MEATDPYTLIASAAETHKIRTIFQVAAEENLDPVLIKGWTVGRFFPENKKRLSTDIDLVVSHEAYDTFLDLIGRDEFGGYRFDVHAGFGDRDALPWNILYSRSQVINLDGVGIRVLADEDNLRLTAAHWLIDGGVYKERLWDIYYLVENRKADFDWELCINSAGPVRRTWVLTAIATARDHLGLNVSELPAEVRDFKLPAWYESVLEREWKLGPYSRMPIKIAYRSPKLLFEQFRRRFPPNAIAATCDTESPFDDSPRWPLQVRSLCKRLMPYLRRS